MFELYMKQLVEDGSGRFTVAKLTADTQEGIDLKRGIYQGDDWQEATEEEYRTQFADRKAHVDGEADIALGEKKEKPAPEKAPEASTEAGTKAEEAKKDEDKQEGVEAES